MQLVLFQTFICYTVKIINSEDKYFESDNNLLVLQQFYIYIYLKCIIFLNDFITSPNTYFDKSSKNR